jgi:hypothetical protein
MTLVARREAIMKPRILKKFYERYRRARFPNDAIGVNVLKSFGIPSERAQSALEIVKANGKYAGMIRDTPLESYSLMARFCIALSCPTATGVNRAFCSIAGSNILQDPTGRGGV